MRHWLSALCAVLVLAFITVPASAVGMETGIAGEMEEKEEVTIGSGSGRLSIDQASDPEYVLGIKGGNYSVEHIADKLEEKGMDVVYLIKTVGRWICIGAFVVCCVLLVLGIIGNPRILLKSAIGAIISGVMYAAITCGEQIVRMIAAWAAS